MRKFSVRAGTPYDWKHHDFSGRSAMQVNPTPAFRDRSTGLKLFGAFQILLGCLCVLFALFVIGAGMMSTAQAPHGQAADMQTMIPAVTIYLAMAIALIWLGVGSILARRWAWALTVILSWLWLIVGVVSCVLYFVVVRPMLSASMVQHGELRPEAIMAMQITIGAVFVCIYVLLPAVLVLFYHRASVRATCQQRDPHIRWTDRCPLPVLALSVLMAYSSASFLSLLIAYRNLVPLFGHFISGPAGALVILLLFLVLASLAWGTYRLQMVAWWGAVLLSFVGVLNLVLTFSRSNLTEMYEKMHVPAAQLELLHKSGFIETMSRWGPWMGFVGGAAFLGYLLYVRRYFVGGREAADIAEHC